MARKRKIVKIGGSHFIRLSPSELIDFNWKEGTIVDIEDCVEVKSRDGN